MTESGKGMILDKIKRKFVSLGKRRVGDASICSRARSVLIRPFGDALGDAIVTTAALRQLKQALPTVKIGVIVSQRNKEFFTRCPLVDEVIEDVFINAWKQRGKWDVFVEYPPVFLSKWIWYTYLLAPHFAIAFFKEAKPSYTAQSVPVYDAYFPKAFDCHLSQYLTLTPFPVSRQVQYFLPETVCQGMYPKDGKKNILLAPYGTTRRISATCLAEVLARLPEQNLRFWLLRRPEAQIYYDTLKQVAPQIDLQWGESTSLDAFLAFVREADGVVAVDSAAVHIACAYQRPLLALYANYEPNIRFIGPLPGNQTELLRSDKPAVNNDDFSSFSAETISPALQRLISRISTAE